MICKICEKDIVEKFGRHLNNHHISKKLYLLRFPEQIDEYESLKKPVWNKGLKKEDHPSIMKSSKAIKEYSNRQEVKTLRSKSLKDRYSNGDILTSQ